MRTRIHIDEASLAKVLNASKGEIKKAVVEESEPSKLDYYWDESAIVHHSGDRLPPYRKSWLRAAVRPGSIRCLAAAWMEAMRARRARRRRSRESRERRRLNRHPRLLEVAHRAPGPRAARGRARC